MLIWCWHRREQIPYIRNLIAGPVKTILTADDLPPYKPGENPVPADCVRYARFRKLQSDLEVAISSRATALKYHEVSALREVMAQTDLVLTGLDLHDRKIMPLTIAEGFCDGVSGALLGWAYPATCGPSLSRSNHEALLAEILQRRKVAHSAPPRSRWTAGPAPRLDPAS